MFVLIDATDPYPLFAFVKIYCSDNLKSLTFKNVNGQMHHEYGCLIQDRLATVESVIVCNRSNLTDIHDCLLKFCHKMKYLKIEESNNSQWLNQTYPNLISLKVCQSAKRNN